MKKANDSGKQNDKKEMTKDQAAKVITKEIIQKQN
jgi:hypothetical protein